MANPTGTVTDLVEWAKAYQALLGVLEHLPPEKRAEGLALLERLGELTVLDVDVGTMYRRLSRGLPHKTPQLRAMFREQYGWPDGDQN